MPTNCGRFDPQKPLSTYGRGRTARLAGHDYAADWSVHLTVCALNGEPFRDAEVAQMVSSCVVEAAKLRKFHLYGYCLMPDHLHVLVSPADSRRPIADYLHALKGYTTRQYRLLRGRSRLWQTTAYDRVLRPNEDTMTVAAYVANNPVRAGLVKTWVEWPYSKIFVE